MTDRDIERTVLSGLLALAVILAADSFASVLKLRRQVALARDVVKVVCAQPVRGTECACMAVLEELEP